MYNLTYLGHRVTLLWLDMWSNFDLDLSRSKYTWFDVPRPDKHDGIKIVPLPLKLKILSSKNRFGKFWNFGPWWPQFWPEPKKDRNDFEMIFRELSNAVFCFVLRCAGAEIDGGCSNTGSRWWKIQRPRRARVKDHEGPIMADGGIHRLTENQLGSKCLADSQKAPQTDWEVSRLTEAPQTDPGYMNRKSRKFRTDKFSTWNKQNFWLMQLM